jgi:hypothetical protein
MTRIRMVDPAKPDLLVAGQEPFERELKIHACSYRESAVSGNKVMETVRSEVTLESRLGRRHNSLLLPLHERASSCVTLTVVAA